MAGRNRRSEPERASNPQFPLVRQTRAVTEVTAKTRQAPRWMAGLAGRVVVSDLCIRPARSSAWEVAPFAPLTKLRTAGAGGVGVTDELRYVQRCTLIPQDYAHRRTVASLSRRQHPFPAQDGA